MGFYDNGKQINGNVNFRAQSQVCGNPQLTHARAVCCRELVYTDVTNGRMVPNVTFFYDGERMKYDTAESRCVGYGKDLCFYEGSSFLPSQSGDFRFQGYGWTNVDCAINVKINK